MKQLGLLLLLLVAVSSSEVKQEHSNDITEYIEIIKCFLNQNNLINDISTLIETIKSEEYDKVLQLALKLYADGTAAVNECIKKEDVSLGSINSQNGNDFELEKKIEEYIIAFMSKYKSSPTPPPSKPNIPQSSSVPPSMSHHDICMIGCKQMYIGYQLSMCFSICNTLYKD